MYLISIYFDKQTNKTLQRYIDKIAEKTNNHFMIENRVPPHITLGKTLDKVQMQKAFQAMQESFVPFTAQFDEIGMAKVNPHEDVARFKLV